ncbi:hypothetical protein LMH87_007250 [Akanthomyces muscarius]|uniref:Uncharacterized protein n=1 Tax=Akanthomyces muscarius TaxID=2231603 RepID=A0A9W8US87_AKAMU|nr:hypothetical protein LMH87_007250 [Akanthomyces muscarius]KAJ4165626.1 hypothetical protein LMH87_007250 [Akanthomyces muscarius]
MLMASKPWLDARDPAADFPTTVKDQACVETRFDNATGLWAYVARYLECSQIPDAGILGSYTRWLNLPNTDPALEYFWQKKGIFLADCPNHDPKLAAQL